MDVQRRHLIGGAIASSMIASMASAQDAQHPSQQPARRVVDPRATWFDMGPTDRPWRIFVGLPKITPPPGGYSLMVALDGNATFPTLWDLRGPGERPTGGQDAFLAMISDDLLPRLMRDLPIDRSDMTLYGHSLGGLFVLHALFSRPDLFARHVAADPSTWWNAGEMLREAAAFRGGVLAAGGRLTPARPLLIANAGARSPDILAPLSGLPGLDLIHRPHPDESHGSLIDPSLRQALDLHLGRLSGP